MYANSKKRQDLIKHSVAVAKVSLALLETMGCIPEKIKRQIFIGGLIHDDGKAMDQFQTHMVNKIEDIDSTEDQEQYDKKELPLHHEASLASIQPLIDYNKNELALHSIYYSHAQPVDDFGKAYTSIDKILSFTEIIESKKNIQIILDALINHEQNIYKEYLLEQIKYAQEEENEACIRGDVPMMWYKGVSPRDKKINSELLLARSCVSRADMFVSKLNNELLDILYSESIDSTKFLTVFSNIFRGGIPRCKLSPPDFYDKDRFNSQVKEATLASQFKTVIFKAPTGYGKTLIGLIWAIITGGQVYWVCPRNSVSFAVFNNLVEEIKNLNIPCSVQLYYSGQLQDSYNLSEDMDYKFTANIVVTNIDNCLMPSVDHSVALNAFNMVYNNVIFDEFHEFVSDEPMFAAFINLMNTRVMISKPKTLLLSATPMGLNFLWDKEGEDTMTVLLPDKENHYSPVYDITYELYMQRGVPETVLEGECCMVSTVRTAQEVCDRNGSDILVHAQYDDTDCTRILKEVIECFGKNSSSKSKKVTSSILLQSAFNISFCGGYIPCVSPESFIQSSGRYGRFGEKDVVRIGIIYYESGDEFKGSNSALIKSLYDSNLQQKWQTYLINFIGESGCIRAKASELYTMYNDFSRINLDDIQSYVKKQYEESMSKLAKMVPTKPRHRKKKDKDEKPKGITSKPNLRDSYGSLFFVVRTEDGNWKNYPFAMSKRDYDMYYEGGDSGNMQLFEKNKTTIVKGLIEAGFEDYSKYLGNIKDVYQRIKKNSNCSLTPMPLLSAVYNHKGLIKFK